MLPTRKGFATETASQRIPRTTRVPAVLSSAGLILAITSVTTWVLPSIYAALSEFTFDVIRAALYAYVVYFPAALLLGTATGSALSMRLTTIGWPELVIAASLATVVLGAIQGLFGGPLAVFLALGLPAFAFFVAGVAGVFLLPLFDPEVRRRGPAPSLRQVLLGAVPMPLLLMFAVYASSDNDYSFLGFGALFIEAALALLLCCVAVALIVAKRTHLASVMGGTGLFIWALSLAAIFVLSNAETISQPLAGF